MCIQHRGRAHLTQEARIYIEALVRERLGCRSIARSVGVWPSTISRELRRRAGVQPYCASKAQKDARRRRANSKHGARKIETDPALEDTIEQYLRGGHETRGDWSPAVIANTVVKGRCSHQSIYAWIRRSRPDLVWLLPHRARRRARYGSVNARKDRGSSLPLIDERPCSVETRTETGHFEGDTVVLKEGRVHTLVERVSRFLIAELFTSKGPGLAMEISDRTAIRLSRFAPSIRRTITYDQGSEFAWWDQTEKSLPGTRIYFAHRYRPWERGTNENTNGLLRRYFPKGQRFATLCADDVAHVVWLLNHRPRKILHWRTPCEVFGHCCDSSLN